MCKSCHLVQVVEMNCKNRNLYLIVIYTNQITCTWVYEDIDQTLGLLCHFISFKIRWTCPNQHQGRHLNVPSLVCIGKEREFIHPNAILHIKTQTHKKKLTFTHSAHKINMYASNQKYKFPKAVTRRIFNNHGKKQF